MQSITFDNKLHNSNKSMQNYKKHYLIQVYPYTDALTHTLRHLHTKVLKNSNYSQIHYRRTTFNTKTHDFNIIPNYIVQTKESVE